MWWSWRELNPRPQAFFRQIYMLSGLIWVSPLPARKYTLWQPPAAYFLVREQAARPQTILCNYPYSLDGLRHPCPAHRPTVVRLTGN